jgi:cation:H+ antiporter
MPDMIPRPAFLPRPPLVAVLPLSGVIAAAVRPGAGGMLNDQGLAPMVERAFTRGKPAAVALAINSPGGSPAQSSLIGARIRRLAEEKSLPVFAFVEDVAASGGYWLATAADEIFVDRADRPAVILLLAGDALVKGAVNLSAAGGYPGADREPDDRGLRHLGARTSHLDQRVLDGKPGLALGNVVGSNTANILLVLGMPGDDRAVLHTSQCNTRKTYMFMIAATGACSSRSAFRRRVHIWAGLALLGGAGLCAGRCVSRCPPPQQGRRDGRRRGSRRVEGADPDMPWWQIGVFLVLGLIGLPLGADLLVDNAIDHRAGIRRGRRGDRSDAGGAGHLAAGACDHGDGRAAPSGRCGAGQRDRVEHVQPAGHHRDRHAGGADPGGSEFLQFDLWVMLGASLLLFPFVFLRQDIGRLWGVALTVLYVVYIVVVLNEPGAGDRRGQAAGPGDGALPRGGVAMTWRCIMPAPGRCGRGGGRDPRAGPAGRGAAGRPAGRGQVETLVPRAAEALGGPLTFW